MSYIKRGIDQAFTEYDFLCILFIPVLIIGGIIYFFFGDEIKPRQQPKTPIMEKVGKSTKSGIKDFIKGFKN